MSSSELQYMYNGVIAFCKCSINPTTNPNPVHSYSIHVIILKLKFVILIPRYERIHTFRKIIQKIRKIYPCRNIRRYTMLYRKLHITLLLNSLLVIRITLDSIT
jgi:hypothetical protein